MANNRCNVNGSGLQRVLSKCQSNIDNGNYYEAHQMYRTLYFRYNSQKKHDDAVEILHKGAVTLLDHDQTASAVDLVMLMLDLYVKIQMPVTQDSTDKVVSVFERLKCDCIERPTLVAASINWSTKVDLIHSRMGHPDLHQRFAAIYWKEENYTQSRYHFVHSNDGHGCAYMLVKHHMTRGYKSEVDLFITQTVLQYLCLQNTTTANTAFFTYTQTHPSVKNGPPYLRPLLNFVWLLLLAIETPKLAVFAILCEKYEPSIKRDPIYKEYLDRIGQLFFGVPAPQSGGFLESLFHDFISGDRDDHEGDSTSPPSKQPKKVAVMDLD